MKIAANTFSQVIVKGITSATTLAATLLITYFLGLHEFGSFIKILTFVSFFYLLIDFGLNPVFLKKHFENLEGVVQNLIHLRAVISLILIIAASVIAFLLPYNKLFNTGFLPHEKIGIVLYSLTLIPFALNLSLQALVQKKLSYHLLIIPNVVSSIALLALVLLGVFNKNLSFILLSYTVSATVFFLLLKRKVDFHTATLSLKRLIDFSKQIIPASLPLALMLILNLAYFKADTIILSIYKPNLDVGIYGFSYRIFEFAITLPTFFANSTYPILLENRHNKKHFVSLIKKYSVWLIALSVVCAVFLVALSPFISILKKEFILSVIPLQILAMSLPFFFLTSLFQWVLIIKNKTKYLLVVYGVTMIINIALNIVFIPTYSYFASSFITVVTEGIVFISLFVLMILTLIKHL